MQIFLMIFKCELLCRNIKQQIKIKSGEKVSATIKAVIFPSHKGVKHITQNGEVELK